jgi:pimeloyl-ACP methyl ester carboxylesterase
MTRLNGIDIHFIHVRSRHPNALPVIITHGWPGSVLEQLKIISPLTDPTGHGGRAEEAFHVVIPSMPGYGFSEKPKDAGWGPERIARTWAELMTRLGYNRYVAQGGDWGSPISSAMARQKAPGLVGIHINLPAVVPPEIITALAAGGAAPEGLSTKERAAFEQLSMGARTGSRSYATMMGTRPQTIGYSLADSPVGLLAWMLGHPGFSTWTYGSNDAEKSVDEVLDEASLYWLTNSGTSASRIYWEYGGRSPIAAGPEKTAEISLPVAITVFPGEVYRAPETWARRAYRNLIYFHEVDRGGHFAAWEQPELFSAELRAAFRTLR